MMRKLCCLFLVVVMLICISPSRSLASSHIDLSRIKFSSGSEPLVFKFGDLSMDGEIRQVYPFTKAEIDKLVKETLKSMGLTELDIMEANKKVERAKRASEFTSDDLQRVKDNFIKSLKVVPQAGEVADILKVIDQYMSSSSWDDIGTASADLLDKSMTDWVKDTASGFIDKAGELGKNVNKTKDWTDRLTAIFDFCDMMIEEHARTKQKWKDIADGANAKRLLNKFYQALQKKIDAYKYESDRMGWNIVFDNAMEGRNFTFFGVDSNYQTWYLDMLLKQKETNEYGSVAGYYEGEFTIRAEHEMSNFTSRAHEAIRNMGEVGAAIKQIEKMPQYKVTLTTSSSGSAYISRSISGTCEATIDESGDITLSMNETNDETMVIISGMSVDMDYSTNSIGVKGVGKLTFKISAQEEDIAIECSIGKIGVITPKGSWFPSLNASGTDNVGWDHEIWKHWDGTEKKLEHAGR